MTDANHGAFDKEEQDILRAIVPEALPVEEVSNDQPGETTGQPSATEATAAPASAEPVTQTAPAAEAAPAAQVTEATAAATEQAQPQGDPRAALRASRRAEKRAREENEQLRAEIDALKQGKAPVDTSISDAELAELDVDFPVQAKIVRKQRELEQRLAQAQPAATEEFEPLSYDPAVQEVIDGVPDLVAWQYDPAAQDKFLRAIEYDKALALDPDWKGRDITERFAEAARRTKAVLQPAPAPTPTPAAQAAPRTDPVTAIANAPVNGPKGISDFRGGGPANAPSINYQGMSDEQIMASLPVA